MTLFNKFKFFSENCSCFCFENSIQIEINFLPSDALGHRNKLLRLISRGRNETPEPSTSKLPAEFLCPITQEMMRDPVLCAGGKTADNIFYKKNLLIIFVPWFVG